MESFDALTIAGIAAAVVTAVFIVRTCLSQGCSRRCR